MQRVALFNHVCVLLVARFHYMRVHVVPHKPNPRWNRLVYTYVAQALTQTWAEAVVMCRVYGPVALCLLSYLRMACESVGKRCSNSRAATKLLSIAALSN